MEKSESGKIRGTVRTKEPGKWPVKDARVTVTVQSKRSGEKGERAEPPVWTNAEGRFEFPDLATGVYQLTCTAFGVSEDVTDIEVRGGEWSEVHSTLIQATITPITAKGREHE